MEFPRPAPEPCRVSRAKAGAKGCTSELPPDMISCHSETADSHPSPPSLDPVPPATLSGTRTAVAVCGPNSNSQRLGHPQHTPQTDTAPQDTALRIPHALTYSAGTLAHHSLATARTQRRVTNLKAWGRARICLLCVSGLPLASPVLPPVPLPRDYCPTEHDHHSSL